MALNPLPIDETLPAVLDRLRQHASLVLRAPTGAGKTTRVPPALVDGGLARRVVMLEPRRLAARAAARRMASERNVPLGADVGYHVRFDRQAGADTRILVVTEGLLARMLHDDPFLERFDAVVFDEFHERRLDSDLALAMTRRVQQTVRPELKLIVMSATLDTAALSEYLDHCPVVTSAGRLFPVDIIHREKSATLGWPQAIGAAVAELLERTPGDVLVFLPGLAEIRQTARYLDELPSTQGLAILPLHGELAAAQQDAALTQQTQRRIVLATNVAETSITVEGVTGVVDTGLARLPVLDRRVGLDRLELQPIARGSADQRAGRAGRLQPGVCIRLWSEANQRGRPEHTEPEIRRVDLAGPALQLIAWGEHDLDAFPFFEKPHADALERARELLNRLGALEDGTLTELGKSMARLPVHPRLARLLIAGKELGCLEHAALAAALLSERDPFLRPHDGQSQRRPSAPSRSDVQDRIEALEEFARSKRTTFPMGELKRSSAHFILRARDHLVRLMGREHKTPATTNAAAEDEALLRALLAAFPDRVARRRAPGSNRARMVGGRGVRLAPASRVIEPELFLCIDVDAGKSEAFVRQASALKRDWLPLTSSDHVYFDAEREAVVARRHLHYEDLVLEESSAALADDEEAARVLAAAAAAQLERVLPEADSAAARFLLRLRCLRAWRPELELPACDEAGLRDLLPYLCQGVRSFAALRRADWLGLLQGQLTPRQLQAIEREAPERIEAPSGSKIALHYEEGRPPILAVRIQEMFGRADTPRIASGRVPVLLHLLAPNQRPQQVTDDLASFWRNTYPTVRKELRARYPKHAWPEDPLSAQPEHWPRRKK